MIDFEITLQGEALRLCPEAALYWPDRETLFVADLHWGKTATFRAHAIAIPESPLYADLNTLSSVIERTLARRLVILGDLLHHRRGRSNSLLTTVQTWRDRHHDLAITLVRGNHDRTAGDPPLSWQIDSVEEGLHMAPFSLFHEARVLTDGFVLAGHLHPKIRLTGQGAMRETLPCFWRRGTSLVMPAFSRFIDGVEIRPQLGDEIFVLAGDQVLQSRTVITPSERF